MTAGQRRAASPGARVDAKTAPGGPAKTIQEDKKDNSPSAATWWMLTPLTPDGLHRIATHQYVGGKYTPLDNLLNPWWFWLTECLPMWLAPNLVTFAGFFPLVLVYVLQWWCVPSADEPAPQWVLFTGLVALFAYQTLDAMDGKQARRTKSSTPLGQLFDHGCDCLAVISHFAQGMAVMGAGGNWQVLLACAVFQSGFFMAQWEEYHTGVLQTAAGPVGVTETQYFLMSLLLGGALLGENLKPVLVNPSLSLFSLPKYDLFNGYTAFMGINMVLCFLRTQRCTSKNGSTLRALLQMVPTMAIFGATFAFSAEVRAREIRLLTLLNGLHNTFLTHQIIIFSMAHQEFPAAHRSLVSFVGLALLSHVLDSESMRACMAIYAALLGSYMLWWILSVTKQITAKLNIEVFRISKCA